LFNLDASLIRNEIRAIKKLCNGTNKNIVEVFGVGEFPDSSYLFIDMELCDLNLDEYMKGNWTVIQVHGYPPGFRETQLWNIMKQIANGISFIHITDEVHRDLKPRNGLSHKVMH
jgi:serine/threonine protein kinase